MRNRDFDDFANARLTPEYREIFEKLRQLVEETVPDAIEVINSGAPAWHSKRILATVSPSEKYLTVTFERGASFLDDHGWLEGSGFNTRHIKLERADEMPDDAIRDYLTQAAALDARV